MTSREVNLTTGEVTNRPLSDEERAVIALERLQNSDYITKRVQEYPPISDQIDVLWKALGAFRAAGNPIEDEANAMLTEILAIKSRHPKDT